MWLRDRSLSDRAAALRATQLSCSGSRLFLELPNHGLGSDLHIWAAAVCNAFETNSSLVAMASGSLKCSACVENAKVAKGEPVSRLSVPAYSDGSKDGHSCSDASSMPTSCLLTQPAAPWAWEAFSPGPALAYPLVPTFGSASNPCTANLPIGNTIGQVEPHSRAAVCNVFNYRGCNPSSRCGAGFTTALEHLFSSLSPHIIDYATAAKRRLLGHKSTPSSLVTVHIRWGDKWKEAALFSADCYVNATARLLGAHASNNERPHVFVTTEDRAALDAFKASAVRLGHSDWAVLAYLPAILQDSRDAQRRSELSPLAAATMQASATIQPLSSTMSDAGRVATSPPTFAAAVVADPATPAAGHSSPTIESLVALLIAVEARLFVLTIASNWSRLIHELRRIRWRASAECPKGWMFCTHDVKLTGSKGTCSGEEEGSAAAGEKSARHKANQRKHRSATST